MAEFDYDLFVIGAGSGGVRASRMAASYGGRVGIAEERYLGGTCVNVGCVPKKLFVYAAHYSEDFHDARGYGWDVADTRFTWQRLRDNKDAEIKRLNGIYGKLLSDAGVTVHEGRARLLDAHTLAIGTSEVRARHILIATGSWPYVPEVPGAEFAVTSNEMFHLESLPSRATVVGGGYIAVEFAGILAGLGVATTLIYRGSLFLRGFDDGIRTFVAEEMRKKGVDLRFETDVARIERLAPDRLRLHLQGPGASSLDTGLVLYATGRRPLVDGLGLENAGIELDERGAIRVDERFRTSTPNVLALGDVIDRFQLTPVAIAEGMAVARDLFQQVPASVDYEAIPTAVFCQPNIGTVGPTEDEARERFGHVKVFESVFRPMKHTMTGSGERTMMKLIVRVSDDRVIAAHMVGPEAGEIIQGLAVAIKAGATKAQFDATVGIHPTAAEEFVTMREPVRR